MSEDWMKPLAFGAVSVLDSATRSYEAGQETTKADLPADEQEALELANRLAANYQRAELSLWERKARAAMSEAEIHGVCLAMREHHDRVIGILESPIERLILPWLITMPETRIRHPLVRTALPTEDDRRRAREIRIVPQIAFGKYRLDFAIVVQLGVRTFVMALECDGRAFHRVPDDAVRDRYLESFGIHTMRVTGSEISGMPDYVALKVADVIEQWIDGKLTLGDP